MLQTLNTLNTMNTCITHKHSLTCKIETYYFMMTSMWNVIFYQS